MSLSNQFGATNSALESIKIRFSEGSDLGKILDYYKNNGHQHVHVRSPDWIANHVKKGQFLLVEKMDGTIIASSATYDYNLTNTEGSRPDYYEMGSTNFNAQEGRGYELYQFMIASQVVMAFLEFPPQKHFIANVYDSSPVGREMLTKIVGWKVIQPEAAILEKLKETKADPTKPLNPMTWYGATSSTLGHQARIVLDYINQGAVTHKKSGKRLNLDLSHFPLANKLKPLVQELAHGRFGQMLEVSSSDTPLAQTRSMLDQYTQNSSIQPKNTP